MKYLQDLSKKIADQKNLIVQPTWHTFLDQVQHEISINFYLRPALYNNAEEFFMEEAYYREMSSKDLRSNIIKKYLHQILTNAIFNYSPCKELIENYDVKKKPKLAEWKKDTQKWENLSGNPYHIVSKLNFDLFHDGVDSTY